MSNWSINDDYPLQRRIETSALLHNWLTIRQRTHAKNLLAVLKSDAYGHGLLTVAKVLSDCADGFAVSDPMDAVWLRDAGFNLPIVLLQGLYFPHQAQYLVNYRLTPVIHSPWQLQLLSGLPASCSLSVYLKVNTGMNRLGFQMTEVDAVLETLRALPMVREVVIMTHFANADVAGGLKKPLHALQALRGRRLPFSLGNSGGSLLHGDIGDDWARVGIALYGGSPAPHWQSAKALGLRAPMTVSTRLTSVYPISLGEQVGYGGDYVAPQPMIIGVAAVGYGDGYPRRQGLSVSLEGRIAPVIGRVSMEMIAIDLSAHPQSMVGDEVIVWGDNPTVDEVATAAQTIAYDLFTCSRLIKNTIYI